MAASRRRDVLTVHVESDGIVLGMEYHAGDGVCVEGANSFPKPGSSTPTAVHVLLPATSDTCVPNPGGLGGDDPGARCWCGGAR